MNFKLKFAGLLAGIAGMVVLTSAMSLGNVPLEVGNEAPEFAMIKSDGSTFRLSHLKGEDVTISFWSIKDAESRAENIRLARKAEAEGTKYIGMCVDSDESLAREVIKADALPSDTQYFANDQIRKEYLKDAQLPTIKIDPYGVVAAID